MMDTFRIETEIPMHSKNSRANVDFPLPTGPMSRLLNAKTPPLGAGFCILLGDVSLVAGTRSPRYRQSLIFSI